jgi:hypothetical protein
LESKELKVLEELREKEVPLEAQDCQDSGEILDHLDWMVHWYVV